MRQASEETGEHWAKYQNFTPPYKTLFSVHPVKVTLKLLLALYKMLPIPSSNVWAGSNSLNFYCPLYAGPTTVKTILSIFASVPMRDIS